MNYACELGINRDKCWIGCKNNSIVEITATLGFAKSTVWWIYENKDTGEPQKTLAVDQRTCVTVIDWLVCKWKTSQG